MIIKRNYLLLQDVRAYELLETIKTFSECKDKQVAAISCDEQGNILSVSWNKKTEHCKGDCDLEDKQCAIHAEAGLILTGAHSVYVSLFPCLQCQMILYSAGVKTIYVFGEQHKEDTGLLELVLLPNIANVLYGFNGARRQESVVIGEMAELTSAICNSQRKDTRDSNVPEEVIDVELQLHCLRRIHDCTESLKMRQDKYNKLIHKFVPEVDDGND